MLTKTMRFATTILFITLGVLTFSQTVYAQPQDLALADELSGIYVAQESITAQNATVPDGEAVTLRAEENIRLDAGFSVESGATYRAEVTDLEAACNLAELELPDTGINSRFFSQRFPEVYHPSLSLNGFSCVDTRTGCDNGLGLSEILESMGSSVPPRAIDDVYGSIANLAASDQDYVVDPSSAQHERTAVLSNVRRLQAYAFAALTTYILQQNGCDEAELNLNPHSTAVQYLRQALLNGDSWKIVRDWGSDGVKWTWLLGGAARTLDLYLALENAYCYYGNRGDVASANECTDPTPNRLLSLAEKRDVLTHYTDQIEIVEDAREWSGPLAEFFDAYDAFHSEPGNRSLKMQAAIGYAALTWQNPFAHPLDQATYNGLLDVFAKRAFEATLGDSNGERRRYWNYQAQDGQPFWAEGPYYFQYALSDVIPFWHTVRINDMLDWHPDFDADDPFTTSQFTRPLHWLADIVTPDGKTPPLDDGNKHKMVNAMLLRWTGDYGDAELGSKFGWIADRQSPQFGANFDNLLVELAIPRIGVEQGQEPADCVGDNSIPSCESEGGTHQQIVIRHEDSRERTHYVLLNGERGEAVDRGEGHEQADQLQLLYYVDGTSYLVDSGYDKAKGDESSTWNHWYDHNVVDGEARPVGDWIDEDPGRSNPDLNIGERRMDSDDMADVYGLEYENLGNIGVLTSGMQLKDTRIDGLLAHFADYDRKVLFVKDPDKPYLIDINWAHVRNDPAQGYVFLHQYHVNTRHAPEVETAGSGLGVLFKNMYGDRLPNNTLSEPNDDHLLIQPFHIDYPRRYAVVSDDVFMEQYNPDNDDGLADGDPLMKLWLGAGDPRVGNDYWKHTLAFTTTTFLQALPDTTNPGAGPLVQDLTGDPSVGGGKTGRAFAWQHDSNTIDVLAVRSGIVFHQMPGLRNAWDVTVPNTNGYELTLPSSADYGFARLVRSGGSWSIDNDYVINFEPLNPLVSRQGGTAHALLATEEVALPDEFNLHTNYPNPFNPTTQIRFDLPEAAHVRLVVYDALGREVTRLVDGMKEAGYHRVTFDGIALANGVYLYRLEAGSYVKTRQMVLMK